MQIKVDITGDKAAIDMFTSLRKQMGDLSPVMDAIGAKMVSNIRERFARKVDPDNKPWAPWAASTAKARAASGRGTLMENSGMLKASASHTAGKSFVKWGFGQKYAKYHEYGAKRGQNRAASGRFASGFLWNLPRRGLLTSNPTTGTLGAADTNDIRMILKAYMAKAIRV